MNTKPRWAKSFGREPFFRATVRLGLPVSSALSALYTAVMLACLLLVGLMTTGSWQAALLGIGWNSIVGYELGLILVVITGFAAAFVFVSADFSLRRRWAALSDQTARINLPFEPSIPYRALRRKVACLVLSGLGIILLRGLVPVLFSGAAPVAAHANKQAFGLAAQLVNLGPVINTAYREAEPSFTADGRTMYFNCYNADICVSHLKSTWKEDNWTPPERLGPPINTEYEEVEPIISAAGDRLYFNSNRPGGILINIPFLSPFMNVFEVVNMIANTKFGVSLLNGLGLGHVWVSDKINGVWSEPHKLNDMPGEPPVNSAFHDHCLAFSADGNEVFWTSTRPGGFGGNDIWNSRRVDGHWTKPENLGPKVNGSGDEHHSMPTPDGKHLYVTSDRPGGYGGEDIYVTYRGSDGKWGPLANLGPLVNGTGNDRCASWTPDLQIFLFDSVREDGYGGIDLWALPFNDVLGHPLASTATSTDSKSPSQTSTGKTGHMTVR